MAINRKKKKIIIKEKVSRKTGETREPSEPQQGCPGTEGASGTRREERSRSMARRESHG